VLVIGLGLLEESNRARSTTTMTIVGKTLDFLIVLVLVVVLGLLVGNAIEATTRTTTSTTVLS
jgi:hypothetical protein